MATIDKSKFQFVKRDDFASETIDAPAYSYWKSVMRQFLKKKSTITMLGILIAIILMSFIYPMFSNFDFNDVSKVNGLEQIVMVSLSLTVFGLVPVTLFLFRLLRRLLIWLSELSLAASGEFPKQLTVS